MGFRLPLDALPYVPDAELDTHPERDPFEPVPPLAAAPTPKARRDRPRYGHHRRADQPREAFNEQGSDPDADRPALRPRAASRTTASRWPSRRCRTTTRPAGAHGALHRGPRGRLYCFMPPLTHLEHWLDLVPASRTPPPRPGSRSSSRATSRRGTPPAQARRDPGPRRHRGQRPPGLQLGRAGARHQILYEEARLTRLGTEKFMLDGRHTGTGGGNHVTLGGPTPADSPLLRRPDLVQSLITYWQHHPSLSYLFSGTFIGPTSQAPRVDEARDDSLYELAIAFQQMPKGKRRPALDRRPGAAQPAGRRHRQHPPHRVLHRQALLAGQRQRPPGPGGVPRLRDAAARAHEPGADAAAAHPGGALLEGALQPSSPCAGAPSCTTASCCRTSSARTSPTSSATCSAPATPSTRPGSTPSSSSASRTTAT
jgi:uncharacterized protein (DUF2126 family)